MVEHSWLNKIGNPLDRYYDVTLAFINGSTIQYSSFNTGWVDYLHTDKFPKFDSKEFTWRIKPDYTQIKYRVALMKYHGIFTTEVVNSLEEAENLKRGFESSFVRWITDWLYENVE